MPPLTARRIALCLVLALVLTWAAFNEEMLFGLLARGWAAVFSALGLEGLLARVQQGTSAGITKKSVPATITGSLLYIGGCLLLLHVLLRSRSRTWLAIRVYLVLFATCVVLLLAASLAHHNELLYKLGRHIIDLTVSPLPVMVLLPLLWPGRGEKVSGF
ncbi:MAG: XrtX-associated membrane protein [Janthinobacterium lividum]